MKYTNHFSVNTLLVLGVIAFTYNTSFSQCSGTGWIVQGTTELTNSTWVGVGECTMYPTFPDAPLSVSNPSATIQFSVVKPSTPYADVFTVDNVGNTNTSGAAAILGNSTIPVALTVNANPSATYNPAGQTATLQNGTYAVFFASNMAGWDFNNLTETHDNGIFWADNYGVGNSSSGLVIAPWAHSASGMRIDAAGNVSIQTTYDGEALNVNGTIWATEVKVCLSGCDFVFEKGYNLMPINDLQTYLQLNHHLPGIASAQEMESDKVELGKLNSSLLQKVEELTLYIIQQQKQIDELNKKVDGLGKTQH